jgi:general secretion pathway protein G
VEREPACGGPRWWIPLGIAGLAIADLVVIAVLLFHFLPGIVASPHPARRTRALAEMSQIRTAARIFRTLTGRDPVSLDDFRRPLPESGDEVLLEVPRDPWGSEYVIVHTDSRIRVTCLGADGKPGGEGEDADFSVEEESK